MAGQAADAPMAEKLLSDLQRGATLLADKANDTNAIRNFAKGRQAWANIPPKANRNQTFSFSRRVYRLQAGYDSGSIERNPATFRRVVGVPRRRRRGGHAPLSDFLSQQRGKLDREMARADAPLKSDQPRDSRSC